MEKQMKITTSGSSRMRYRLKKKIFRKYQCCPSCLEPYSFIAGKGAFCHRCNTLFQIRSKVGNVKPGPVKIYNDGKRSREENAEVIKVVRNKNLLKFQRDEAKKNPWLFLKNGETFLLVKHNAHYFIAGQTLNSGWFGLNYNYSVEIN